VNVSDRQQPTVFFTIVARNYIAYARTLCQSIARHHPGSKIYIGLSDRLGDGVALGDDDFEIVTVDQLDLPNPDQFAFRYDVMEFSTAIKPYMFRRLFATTDAEAVVYLDPDILVLSPLEKVLGLLGQGATAVLTPHLTARVDDGHNPDETTMLRVGVYNLGFIGVSRHGDGPRLVDWWCDRLERGAVVDLDKGLFTDQKWADLMPSLFDGVAILRSPGYNVAYWNLMHRQVACVDGEWRANGEPISFFHFSGVDPRNPGIFSKHQDRYSVQTIGELRVLYERYVELLKQNGYFDTVKTPYGYGGLADGSRIHPAMRAYFRQFLDSGANAVKHPFETLGADYFDSVEKSLAGNTLVSRLMYGLFRNQKELQTAFDLATPQGQATYANWFAVMAADIYGIDAVFVATARERLSAAAQAPASAPPLPPSSLKQSLGRWFARRAFQAYRWNPGLALRVARMLPAPVVAVVHAHANQALGAPAGSPMGTVNRLIERLLGLIARSRQGGQVSRAGRGAGITVPHLSGHGITLVGYVQGDFGVAQNLRAVAGSLAAVEYPYDIFEVGTDGAYSESDSALSHLVVDGSTNALQLYCVNADQLRWVSDRLGVRKTGGRYRIGCWFWELANFPADWMHAFDYVDEIWAPSRFICENLTRVSPKPVIYMPVAVDFTIRGTYSRSGFHLPDDKFLFLFSYDFHSFSQRKNPEAVIAAFQQAFPSDQAGVGLVVKTVYGEKHPEAYLRLLELAQEDPRIRVINRVLSRDEMYGLIDSCDCYVSLHRAEGFGLGLAEAMLLGKPVIGTGYSGNLDFMTPENSCLVDCTMVPVARDAYPYWDGQEWAEPDIGQAAGYMARLFEDAAYRARIAALGRDRIRRDHSHARVGSLMRERLDTLAQSLPSE
jgi:glycosyltransferase involved in cell wall biosynthesis